MYVFTRFRADVAIGGMKTRHYSPQLEREVVSALYHEAKSRKIPMTALANQLIEAALRGGDAGEEDTEKLIRLRRTERLKRAASGVTCL